MAERFTGVALRYQRWTLAVATALTLVMAMGLAQLETEFGYRALIGDDHPAISRLDRMIAEFGGGLPVRIAWQCGVGQPCASAFDSASLQMADTVTRLLASADGVLAVRSPSNSSIRVPSPAGFSLRRLVVDGERVADADSLARIAQEDPLWVGQLVSSDGLVGSIIVQSADSDADTSLALVDQIDAALQSFEAAGFRFYVVGDPVESVVSGRELAQSSARMVPLTVLVTAAVVFGLTYSWLHTLLALGTVGVALVWTLGLMGWLGWPQDGIHEVVAPLILVVGIADAIHVLSRLGHGAKSESALDARSSSVLTAARDVGPSCVITSLTTAAAFLSFAGSPLDTFQRFAVVSSFGVLACLVLTFSLLPVLVTILPPGRQSEAVSRSWPVALGAAVDVSDRRSVPILAASLIIAVLGIIGWMKYLHVDNNWVESWGAESELVRSIRFIESTLGPSNSLEVMVEFPRDESLFEPGSMAKIAELSGALSRLDGLGAATSVLDLIRPVNQLIHDNDERFHSAGASGAANAEILELLELEDAAAVGSWVSLDRSAVRISVEARQRSYVLDSETLQDARSIVAETLPQSWFVTLSGDLAINHEWVREVQATQLVSFPVALLVVFVLVAAFFRSTGLALAALVPTVLPVLATLGAMGWLGLSLDVGRAMIAAVLIGIGVDDSVHILRRYSLLCRQMTPRMAIRMAVLDTGRAVVTTSLALAVGFLTLLASAWQSIASFGFFVSVAVLGALVSAIFVLPALIFVTRGRGESSSEEERQVRRRNRVVLMVLAPVGVAIAVAGGRVIESDTRVLQPCFVLPGGHVVSLPGVGDCPLGLFDRVVGVRLPGRDSSALLAVESLAEASGGLPSDGRLDFVVASRGAIAEIQVPFAIEGRARAVARLMGVVGSACMLMWLPVILLRRGTSSAALPLGVFLSATVVVLVAATVGRDSGFLAAAAVGALLVGPAALAHMSLVFPREGTAVSAVPQLKRVPYAVAAVLAAVAFTAVETAPLLWSPLLHLVLFIGGCAWSIVLLSCAFSVRESQSAVEAQRSRFVLAGMLLVPAVPAAFVSMGSSGTELLASYLWLAALSMPLPIGLAISHYNLFDLGWDVRHWIARLLYFGIGALASAALVYVALGFVEPWHSLRDLGALFGAALCCLFVVEGLRRPLLGWLESLLTPRLDQLRDLRERYSAAMVELRDEDAATRLLSDVLKDGLEAKAGCVLLARGEDWRPAGLFGDDPPARLSLVDAALALLHDRSIVHLPLEADRGDRNLDLLESEGVEVVASVGGNERLGLVLLGPNPRNVPYTGVEVDFVAMATAHAANALRNARLAGELVAKERHAATARVAVALMHDIGKDLGWIRRLVTRVAKLGEVSDRSGEMAEIRDLADSVVSRMKQFMAEATAPRADPPGVLRLDEMLDDALRRLTARHGERRVHQSIDPEIRGLRCHENLGRVASNLVENGLQASAPDGLVQVSLSSVEGSLQLTVSDAGCGLADETLERAFEPGFTTRRDEGGSGVGLAVSRDIVEAMAGKIELRRLSGGGTCAVVRVPMSSMFEVAHVSSACEGR